MKDWALLQLRPSVNGALPIGTLLGQFHELDLGCMLGKSVLLKNAIVVTVDATHLNEVARMAECNISFAGNKYSKR